MQQYDNELIVVGPVGELDIFLEHIPEMRNGFVLSQWIVTSVIYWNRLHSL